MLFLLNQCSKSNGLRTSTMPTLIKLDSSLPQVLQNYVMLHCVELSSFVLLFLSTCVSSTPFISDIGQWIKSNSYVLSQLSVHLQPMVHHISLPLTLQTEPGTCMRWEQRRHLTLDPHFWFVFYAKNQVIFVKFFRVHFYQALLGKSGRWPKSDYWMTPG